MTQSTEVSIPQNYNYFRAIETSMGRSIKWKLERHAKCHLDIPDEVATGFGRAMNTGDRLGDAYIDNAFAAPAGKRGQARTSNRPSVTVSPASQTPRRS